jgi:hypothetical protein
MGSRGSRKHSGSLKGDRTAGSMAVFLASADEARTMIERRTVKIAGQIAFVGHSRRYPGQSGATIAISTDTTSRGVTFQRRAVGAREAIVQTRARPGRRSVRRVPMPTPSPIEATRYTNVKKPAYIRAEASKTSDEMETQPKRGQGRHWGYAAATGRLTTGQQNTTEGDTVVTGREGR